MKRDNDWMFDDKIYDMVKKEISKWPEWKKEYYEETYVGVGKSYYDSNVVVAKAGCR